MFHVEHEDAGGGDGSSGRPKLPALPAPVRSPSPVIETESMTRSRLTAIEERASIALDAGRAEFPRTPQRHAPAFSSRALAFTRKEQRTVVGRPSYGVVDAVSAMAGAE